MWRQGWRWREEEEVEEHKERVAMVIECLLSWSPGLMHAFAYLLYAA